MNARRRQSCRPLGLCVALLLLAHPAVAAPVWRAGWDTGICGAGDRLAFTPMGWCNAVDADVLFLREGGRDFGIGPSMRLGTARFDDVRLDAGVSVLLPVLDSFPLVLEVGPHLRNFHEPGIYGSAFFGLRSFNYYGHYEMAAGLSITAERALTSGTPSALWITARVDGSWLMLPVIFVVNGLK